MVLAGALVVLPVPGGLSVPVSRMGLPTVHDPATTFLLGFDVTARVGARRWGKGSADGGGSTATENGEQ
jgi:hypothetical protein